MPEDTHTVYSSLTAKESLAAWQLRHTTRPLIGTLLEFCGNFDAKWHLNGCNTTARDYIRIIEGSFVSSGSLSRYNYFWFQIGSEALTHF